MMRRIPRYNYASQFGEDFPVLMQALEQMLLEGNYVLTAEVTDFEKAWGKFLGVRHVRAVNTGTDALVIALLSLGIGPGDEVITQANSFNATVAAIRLVGAKPILVDVDEDSFLMDQRRVAEVITSRTRVLMPVHLFGKPTPMEHLLWLAHKHDLAIVEDAAQAHGARINNRMAGTIGNVGCFSFHPSKNLAAAGDGGPVVTNDDALAEVMRQRRELGQSGQNHHVAVGLNSKLDSIQARILSHKLPHLDHWNEKRRLIASLYRERLSDLPLSFQCTSSDEQHVFHLFQVRTDCRDAMLSYLRAAGIDVTIRYPTPIHLQPAFSDQGWRRGDFPIAERLANELLCLPIRPDMGVDEVDYVADCLRSFFRGGLV
jgi:dTDP-4-amino-4,6-dideoxygalactose transaminase